MSNVMCSLRIIFSKSEYRYYLSLLKLLLFFLIIGVKILLRKTISHNGIIIFERKM